MIEEETLHREAEFNRILRDATLQRQMWDRETELASTRFYSKSHALFRVIAQNYYDECELGRLTKAFFDEAIEEAID